MDAQLAGGGGGWALSPYGKGAGAAGVINPKHPSLNTKPVQGIQSRPLPGYGSKGRDKLLTCGVSPGLESNT